MQSLTTNKLKSSIFLKFCYLKTFFQKHLLICLKMIFLWWPLSYKNLSDPNYGTSKSLYDLLTLTHLFQMKLFYHVAVRIHHF